MHRATLPVLTVLVLIACATTDAPTPQSSIVAGSSRLVVFRGPGLRATFAAPSIYINGQEVGKLYGKTCIEVSLQPGAYEFRSEGHFFNWPGPPRIIQLSLKPNAVHYVQLTVFPGGGPAIVSHGYSQPPESDAKEILKEIGECEKKP